MPLPDTRMCHPGSTSLPDVAWRGCDEERAVAPPAAPSRGASLLLSLRLVTLPVLCKLQLCKECRFHLT